MSDFSLDPTGLDGLSTSIRQVAGAVQADAARPSTSGTGDLGPIASAYEALVERFAAGLRTARGAVEQTADEVDACLAAYAATDDDAAVTFTGLQG